MVRIGSKSLGGSHMAEVNTALLGVTEVVLVAEQPLLREGLRALLEREGDVHIVAEGADLAAVQREVLQPNVVVMDLGVPGPRGLEALHAVATHFSSARVVALALACSEPRQVTAVIEAGARVCLIKGTVGAELLAAVRSLAKDEPWRPRTRAEHHVGLSPREQEVLQLLAEGLTSKEIASQLKVAVSTVETHRKQIMSKLELHSIASLTRFAIRNGLASLD